MATEGLEQQVKSAEALRKVLDDILTRQGKEAVNYAKLKDDAIEREKLLRTMIKLHGTVNKSLIKELDLKDDIVISEEAMAKAMRESNRQAAHFEDILTSILATSKEANETDKEKQKLWKENNVSALKNLGLMTDHLRLIKSQRSGVQDLLDTTEEYAKSMTQAGKAALRQQEAIAAELTSILNKGKDLNDSDLARIGILKKQLKVSKELEDTQAKMIEKYGDLKEGGRAKRLLAGGEEAKSAVYDKLKGGGWKSKEARTEAAAGADAMGKMLGETLGKVFSGLGGFITKALGPIGWAIAAISAVVDKIVELDNFRKEQVNAFQKMAGPQFDGDEFAKQAQGFNDAIFDVERNLRLGVDYKEWQGMFKAFQSGGMTFDSLQKQVGDFGQVMESTRVISLEMGTDVATAGAAMAEMATSTNAPLEDMNASFHAIAVSAKKAGMSSEKFLGIVKQSTLALGSYGNFTKMATKSLEAFAKTGLSQEDASKAATSSQALFDNKDFGQTLLRSGLMGASSGASGQMRGMLSQSLDSRKSRRATLESTGQTDTKEYLQLNVAINELEKAVAKGSDPTMLADGFKYATEHQGEAIALLMTGAIGHIPDLIDGSVSTIAELVKTTGVTAEMVAGYQSKAINWFNAANKLTDQLGTNQGAAASLADDKGLEAMLKEPEKATKAGIDALLKKYGDMGLDTKMLRQVIDNPKAGLALLDAVRTQMKTGDKHFKADRGLNKKIGNKTATGIGGLGGEQAASTAKMVSELTPIEKSMGITKDALEWYTASSGPAEASAKALLGISNTTGDILGWMMRDTNTEINKAADAAVRDAPGKADAAKNVVGEFSKILKGWEGKSTKEIQDMVNKTAVDSKERELAKHLGATQKGMLGEDVVTSGLSGNLKGSNMLGKAVSSYGTENEADLQRNLSRLVGTKEAGGKTQMEIDALDKEIAKVSAALEKVQLGSREGFKALRTSSSPETRASGIMGGPIGTDRVHALLTPGELVANAGDQKIIADLIRGSYGPSPMSAAGSSAAGKGAPSINVVVNVSGTGMQADEVAAAIERKMKQQNFWTSMTA